MKITAVEENLGPWAMVGRCTSPFGIRGGVRAQLRGPRGLLLNPTCELGCVPGGLRRAKKIHWSAKGPILFFEGIEDRQKAQDVLPFEIFAPSQGLPHPWNLIGFRVFDALTGQRLGTLEDFYFNGAQEVAVVSSWEFPFVGEFVKSIDQKSRHLEVAPPEYR